MAGAALGSHWLAVRLTDRNAALWPARPERRGLLMRGSVVHTRYQTPRPSAYSTAGSLPSSSALTA